MSTRCTVHNAGWRTNKWACEYFLIWCRDVAGLDKCSKEDTE